MMTAKLEAEEIRCYILGALQSGTTVEVIREQTEEAKRIHDQFACPRCGKISHNPNDVRERYCGACHEFFTEN